MKAFFNSILKPAQPKQQQQAYPSAVVATPAAAAAATASQTAANAAATAAPSSSQSASSPPAAASSVAAAVPSASSSTAATAAAAPAVNAAPAAAPTAAPASSVTALDRKLAASSLDSYTGVISCVFDHSIPLKREQEFFLERMEEVFGRDPVLEIPKATAAARTINLELPIAREKGTLSCQQTNAMITSTLSHCSSFFAAAALKDDARRDHRIASLSRLKALSASLDAEVAEAKRQQHNMYVAEFARMHDKYGRNLDGSKKKEYNAAQNMAQNTAAALALAQSNANAAAAAAAAAANANPAGSDATTATSAQSSASDFATESAAPTDSAAASSAASDSAASDAAAAPSALPGAS